VKEKEECCEKWRGVKEKRSISRSAFEKTPQSSVHARCLYLRRMCVHARVCLLLSVRRPVCHQIRKPVFLPLPTNSSKRFVRLVSGSVCVPALAHVLACTHVIAG
jgi:hypothetical protein